MNHDAYVISAVSISLIHLDRLRVMHSHLARMQRSHYIDTRKKPTKILKIKAIEKTT